MSLDSQQSATASGVPLKLSVPGIKC